MKKYPIIRNLCFRCSSTKHIGLFVDTECNLEELTALLDDDNNNDDDSKDGFVTSNTSELEKAEGNNR